MRLLLQEQHLIKTKKKNDNDHLKYFKRVKRKKERKKKKLRK